MRAEKKYVDAELIAAIKNDKELDNAILFIYQQFSETVSSFITNNGGKSAGRRRYFPGNGGSIY
jgi:hypothetical protein